MANRSKTFEAKQQKAIGSISRRGFLSGIAAAGAASFVAMPRRAMANSGEVVVANWGGGWNERTVRFIEQPLVERAGIKVVHDLGSSGNRKTKLLAQKRLPRASIDVSHHNGHDAYYLNTQDVWETIDEQSIPNLANVYPRLKTSYSVPWQYSGWVIAYNPARISEAPKSYTDLWNPKYAGKVGMNETGYPWHIQSAALAAGGGDPLDWPRSQQMLLDLKKAVQPRIYPSHEALGVALKNEEVWIACNFRSRVLQYANEGIKVKPAYPDEGAISVVYSVCMTKRAPNKDNALFYLNALLDPKGMAGLVQESFYSPAVGNALLSPDLKTKLQFSPEEQDRLHFPDLDRVASFNAEWLNWWNREFKA